MTRSAGPTMPHDLLTANTTEARAVLDGVLADRIRFTPDEEQRRYRLTMPFAFDRVLSCLLPELVVTRNSGVPNGGPTRVDTRNPWRSQSRMTMIHAYVFNQTWA